MDSMNLDNVFYMLKKGRFGRDYKSCLKRASDMTEGELAMCAPVPLECVLKEIGWKRKGGSLNYYTEIGGYYAQWSNNEQFNYLLKIKHPDKDDFLHIHDVRYLHQLQNIFKVFTGIKLPNVEELIKI